MKMKIEAIANTVNDVARLSAAGVDRIRLCQNIEWGGYTPYEHSVNDAVAVTKIPIYVMVRRNHESWVIEEPELKDEILGDVVKLSNTKAKGIVFGSLTKTNKIDKVLLKRVIKNAGKKKVVFGRAFDFIENKAKALEELKLLGIKEVLTSVGGEDAVSNLEEIRELNKIKGIKLIITGGINFQNRDDILSTGVEWLSVGNTFREDPSDDELKMGPTMEIPTRKKDENGKKIIKIVEPRPFHSFDKRVDIEKTQEFKINEK